MPKKPAPRSKTYPQPVNNVLEQWMAALDRAVGQSAQGRLVRLWQNWDMVMGPELAAIAWPLGHRGNILLVGGEDAMIMQELSLQTGEILERVNAFMDEALFTEVRVSLALGKNPLNSSLAVPPPRQRPVLEPGPAPSGMYLGLMNPESAVAKCYARFANKPL